MQGPQAAYLDAGQRLHLHHGPIDLIIGAEADTPSARQRAFDAAQNHFEGLLETLVQELALLRRPVGPVDPEAQGPVARRMRAAALPHAPQKVSPMIAVAGAVADEILQAMLRAAPLNRAYVNNGGDIAVHLTAGKTFAVAIASDRADGLGRVEIGPQIGGIATSGAGGRSLSLGIADSVTVLAKNAAAADAAATLIANAVDLPGHPAIQRAPADTLDPDSDLGARLVVTSVAPLSAAHIDKALTRGLACANAMYAKGQISAAALFLQGRALTTQDFAGAQRALAHV